MNLPARAARPLALLMGSLVALSLASCAVGGSAPPPAVMGMCLAVPAIDQTGPSQTGSPVSVLFRRLGDQGTIQWRKQGSTHVFEIPREDVVKQTKSKLVFEMREIDLPAEGDCGPITLMVSRVIGSNGDEITGYAVWDAVMGLVQQARLEEPAQPPGRSAAAAAAAQADPSLAPAPAEVVQALTNTRDAELQASNRELNETYAAIMARLPEADQEGLRNSQRLWIEFRDSDCSFGWGDLRDCQIARTSERTQQLKSSVYFDGDGARIGPP